MMKPLLNLLLLSVFLVCINSSVSAQLEVDAAPTADELAASLVGAGVIVTDVTFNCADGAMGSFDCIDCNVGIAQGVLLTSGQVSNAPGPNNNSGATGDNFFPGDADLDAIPGVLGTNDACSLEFDVTVTSDTLKFNYVFGSEEYLEYVGSFNDVFAFYISGPGIVGSQNIALIPGTATPVSINNVNNVTNSSYYHINGDGFTPPYSTDDYYIQYDGFTTVLEAKSVVEPCETYHLKLVIADDLDDALDSGVFIEAGSLSSPSLNIEASTAIDGYPYLIEGCVDGDINFHLSYSPVDTLIIHYEIGGTATNGIDYNNIPDSIIIYPGETDYTLPIDAISDGLIEADGEYIQISLLLDCSDTPYDSVRLYIYDDVPLTCSPSDTTICSGTDVTLYGAGAVDYSWSPEATLSDPDSAVTVATPITSTIYTLTGTVGDCVKSISVPVDVSAPPTITTSGDAAICIGSSTTISATGGVSYAWSPAAGLSDAGIANPSASPTTTTTYTVIVTNEFGCQSVGSLTITVNPLPIVVAGPEGLACYGEEVQLNATGGTGYLWSPADNIDNATLQNPTITIFETTAITVTVTDDNGCVNTATFTITLDPTPHANAGLDTTIYLGESAILHGTGGDNVSWTPDTYLNDPSSLNPVATPPITTQYILTVLSDIGCLSTDSVTVHVVDRPLILFPSAFSPNGDNVNDFYAIIARGDVANFVFRIYNRWGEVLFESTNLSDTWDGKFNGNELDMGTYIYSFQGTDLTGHGLAFSGNFILVR